MLGGALFIILFLGNVPCHPTELINTFYSRFDIKTGVKQGCNMSGFLFLIIMDWVKRRTVGNGENGKRWRFTSKLDDLDFADDIALISSTKQQIQNKTTKLEEEARREGLKVSTERRKR